MSSGDLVPYESVKTCRGGAEEVGAVRVVSAVEEVLVFAGIHATPGGGRGLKGLSGPLFQSSFWAYPHLTPGVGDRAKG